MTKPLPSVDAASAPSGGDTIVMIQGGAVVQATVSAVVGFAGVTTPAVPSGLALSQQAKTAADGTVQRYLVATWDANGESDLAGYIVALSLNAGAYDAAPVETNSARWAVQSGDVCLVKVRAFNTANRKSAYCSPSSPLTIADDTSAPGVVTSGSVTAKPRGMVCRATAPGDANFGGAQVYVNTSNTAGTATALEFVKGQPGKKLFFTDDTPRTSGTAYYYFMASVSRAGVESATRTAIGSAAYLGVRTADIDPGQVGTAALAAGAVGSTQLASGAVGAANLATGAVDLTASTVTGALPGSKLASGAVAATNLATGAVDLAGTKVTGQVPGGSIAAGAIDATKLATGAVDLSSATVTGKDLANVDPTRATKVDGVATGATKNVTYRATTAPTGGTYTTGDRWIDTSSSPRVTYAWTGSAWEAVGRNTTATTQLSDAGALSRKNTAGSGDIDAGSIAGGHLANGAVDLAGAKITGALGGANIAAGAVAATQLATGAVDLSTTKVTGALPGARIAAGAVGASNLATGAVDLSTTAVTGALPGSKLAAGAVGPTNLVDGAVDFTGTKVSNVGGLALKSAKDLTDVNILITAASTLTLTVGTSIPSQYIRASNALTVNLSRTGAQQGDAFLVACAESSQSIIVNDPLSGSPLITLAPGMECLAVKSSVQWVLAYARPILLLSTKKLAYAVLPIGTGASTVAAGDDSRFAAALQASANLSDLGNLRTAQSNLGIEAGLGFFNDNADHTVTWGTDGWCIRYSGTQTASRRITLSQGVATQGCLFRIIKRSASTFSITVYDALSATTIYTLATKDTYVDCLWTNAGFEVIGTGPAA